MLKRHNLPSAATYISVKSVFRVQSLSTQIESSFVVRVSEKGAGRPAHPLDMLAAEKTLQCCASAFHDEGHQKVTNTLHPDKRRLMLLVFGCVDVNVPSAGCEPKARKTSATAWSDSACREKPRADISA